MTRAEMALAELKGLLEAQPVRACRDGRSVA